MIYKMTLTDSTDSMTMDLLEVPIADTDVEGAVDNTTIDGNVFTDYLWLKKKYVQKWSIMCPDEYDRLRGFYTRQWANASPAQYRLFYGENIFTDYSESGDYIVVNNPSDISAPVTNFAMYGDATQQTYSGKNLFGGLTEYFVSYCTYTLTNNILTITPTDTTHNTGVGFLLGTPIPSGTTVHLSSATSVGASTQLRDSSNTVVANFGNGIDTTKTLSGTADRIVFNWYSTGSTTPFTVDLQTLQIEAGSSKTDYEPYVGGIPAPNPDYPQEIHTVTGENTLKIVGKNLFDINSLAQGGISVVDGVAIATASNFHTSVGWNTNGVKLPFIPSGRVTITATAWTNGNASTAQNVGLAFRIYYTDGAYESINFDNNLTSPTTKTFVSNASKTVAKVCITYGNTGSNVWQLTKVQIEEGTTATEFEDFSEQEQKINLVGKNLVDSLGATWVNTKATLTENDGVLEMLSEAGYATRCCLPLSGLIDGQTYTLTCDIKAVTISSVSNSTVLRIRETSSGGSWVSSQLSITESNDFVQYKITFTATSVSNPYVWFYLSSSNANTNNVNIFVKNIQLELGSTATTYAPYFPPIELAEIMTYQDTIRFGGAKWWLHKEVGKVVLDGTEAGWGAGATSTVGLYRYNYNFSPIKWGYRMAISDYFTMADKTQFNDIDTVCFATHPNQGMLVFFTHESTLADFKTWLGTHNTAVYYALATPTDTEITDSTLLSQLNAIYELYVKSGKNSILIIPTSPNLQPDFDIGYRVFSEQETDIVSIVPVRLGLTDDGVINTCGCRRNIQLTMRETIQ